MSELEKIIQETSKKLGVEFLFYAEKSQPKGVPVCDKQFETVTDDGTNTYFRFTFKNNGYVGVLKGVGQEAKNYAALLPAYVESFVDKEADLSKTEYLKKILQEYDMENPDVEGDHGSYSFYVSDAADKFKQFANSILPYDIETTKQINIEEY